MEFYFGIGAQRTTETGEHTDDEKECPRFFLEKEGGWARGKEIIGCVLTVVACPRLSPAPPHSASILFLPFANSDSATMRIRVGVIFLSNFKVLQLISRGHWPTFSMSHRSLYL